MNQYKCSESARQKCPDRSICGEGTYTGIDCECAKFNERCLPTKERNIIFELQQENAALKSERDELKKALEMACREALDAMNQLCKAGIIRCTKNPDSTAKSQAEYFIQQAKEEMGRE